MNPTTYRRNACLAFAAALSLLPALGRADVTTDDYDLGWRAARVLAVGPSDSIPVQPGWDCRSDGTSNATATAQDTPWVARVQYHQGKMHLTRVVPVDARTPPAVNDAVRIAIRDCSQPLRPL